MADPIAMTAAVVRPPASRSVVLLLAVVLAFDVEELLGLRSLVAWSPFEVGVGEGRLAARSA